MYASCIKFCTYKPKLGGKTLKVIVTFFLWKLVIYKIDRYWYFRSMCMCEFFIPSKVDIDLENNINHEKAKVIMKINDENNIKNAFN